MQYLKVWGFQKSICDWFEKGGRAVTGLPLLAFCLKTELRGRGGVFHLEAFKPLRPHLIQLSPAVPDPENPVLKPGRGLLG